MSFFPFALTAFASGVLFAVAFVLLIASLLLGLYLGSRVR